MIDRRTTPRWLLPLALLAASAPGCGYSEDEMQARTREIEGLKTQIAAEQEQNRKARAELDEQAAKIEQLKQQLRSAGVDISNLNANLEQQARAMEEQRRRAEQTDALRRRYELLRDKLQPLANQGVSVAVRGNRMLVLLPEGALFDAGRDTPKKDGERALLKVAEVVRNDPALAARSFQVACHVDEAPAAGGKGKDPWQVSVARAREVLAILVRPADKGGGGLNPGRWSAAGYGAADPIKPNDSPEGRQANRRCELVALPNAEEMLDLKDLGR